MPINQPTSQQTPVRSPLARYAIRAGWLVVACLALFGSNLMVGQLNDYVVDLIRQCGIAIIMAVSLNIVNGLTGQFSIGHAGFMSIGAYTGASVTYFVAMRNHGGAPGIGWMLAAMGAGGVAAAMFGYLVGVPSLRLRGDYLAIVTLGFGEIIRVLLANATTINSHLNYMGGATGFSGDSGSYSVPRLSTFPVIYGTVIVLILLARNLKFSPQGLAFMSIREDEIAADAMGVNTTRMKVTAFVVSAFFAGIGGVLYAHALFFQPTTFGFILSINYVVMIVLGGTGSITGATLAAVAITALPDLLKPVQDRLGFADVYRYVVYAILLVLMMILRPSGVFGTGELSFRKLRRFFTRNRSAETSPDVNSPVSGAAQTDVKKPPADATPHDRPLLEAVGLTRRFGGLTALGDVNLAIEPGELVGLIGPNGAGKTTLFNLLTGVYAPSAGVLTLQGEFIGGDRPYSSSARMIRIVLDACVAGAGGYLIATIIAGALVPYAADPGRLHLAQVIRLSGVLLFVLLSAVRAPSRRRLIPGMRPYQFAHLGISRTFQNIRLFSGLTVLENVRIGAYLRRGTNLFDALFRTARLEREEVRTTEHCRELLARFNLLRFENELARNLPYGDQRRLEIVRALATGPKLLLLDEPAAGMNPQEKVGLMTLIRQIRDDFGLTILLIEHDMKLVMGICERIYVLDYGKVIAQGTPEEIRSDPRVIAAYLGEELEEQPALARAATPDAGMPLPAEG